MASSEFKRWNDAHTAAVLRARALVAGGLDPRDAEQGIEWNPLFKYFTISGLPRRENRAGWELRCEVVRPGDPIAVSERTTDENTGANVSWRG